MFFADLTSQCFISALTDENPVTPTYTAACLLALSNRYNYELPTLFITPELNTRWQQNIENTITSFLVQGSLRVQKELPRANVQTRLFAESELLPETESNASLTQNPTHGLTWLNTGLSPARKLTGVSTEIQYNMTPLWSWQNGASAAWNSTISSNTSTQTYEFWSAVDTTLSHTHTVSTHVHSTWQKENTAAAWSQTTLLFLAIQATWSESLATGLQTGILFPAQNFRYRSPRLYCNAQAHGTLLLPWHNWIFEVTQGVTPRRAYEPLYYTQTLRTGVRSTWQNRYFTDMSFNARKEIESVTRIAEPSTARLSSESLVYGVNTQLEGGLYLGTLTEDTPEGQGRASIRYLFSRQWLRTLVTNSTTNQTLQQNYHLVSVNFNWRLYP